MDTDSYIVHIKTKDIYKDILKDFLKRFDTLRYELEMRLPKEKNKKVIGLMIDELCSKIRKELVGLGAKT